MSIAYLNGNFLPIEQANISVLDRGFLFGDSVYEVIPVYNGQLFHAKEHIDRFSHSLDAISLEIHADWLSIFENLVHQNNGGDLQIYLQVTRGADNIRQHAIPKKIEPTIFACVMPFKRLSHQRLKAGFSAMTLPDLRWHNCYVKSTMLLPNVLSLHQAQEAQYDDAILIKGGYALESTSANLFIVNNGVLITTPVQPNILRGITRDLILRLARKNNIPTQERMITETELENADEIWISSSTKEVYPITRLNHQVVGNGEAGPIWEKMSTFYRQYTKNYTP